MFLTTTTTRKKKFDSSKAKSARLHKTSNMCDSGRTARNQFANVDAKKFEQQKREQECVD